MTGNVYRGWDAIRKLEWRKSSLARCSIRVRILLENTTQSTIFLKKKKSYNHCSYKTFLGGDKRDRTADLLNAIDPEPKT